MRRLTTIFSLVLLSNTSLAQTKWDLPFNYEDLDLSFSEFVFNKVKSSEHLEKDFNTKCRKGMFLFSFRVNKKGNLYDIQDSQGINTEELRETTRLRGLIKSSIKISEPYWRIPNNQKKYWADKEFLLPVIYSMSCLDDKIPLDDSFNSLFILKNIDSDSNYLSQNMYRNSKKYTSCILLHPVIILGILK